jgi:hypothetical protein
MFSFDKNNMNPVVEESQLLERRRSARSAGSQKLPSKEDYIPLKEWLTVGKKSQFNLANPKFGIQNYVCKDSTLKDKIYKIQGVALSKLKKDDKKVKRDTFFDDYVKT